MSVDKGNTEKSEMGYAQFMRFPVFIVLVIAIIAMFLGVLPAGMIGGMCCLLPLALILEKVGARIPILKDYLGGSPLLLIFFGASLVYFGIIPQKSVDNFSSFMRNAPKNQIYAEQILKENPEKITDLVKVETGKESLTVDSLSLIHISEPTRRTIPSRMPSSA